MKKIIVHPLLFAIYPALFFYAQNKFEAEPQALLFPLLISLAGVLTGWIISYIFLRNAHKSALIASFLAILFFSFGHLQNFFKDGIMPWVLLGIMVTFSILTIRSKKSVKPVATALTLISLYLVLSSALDIFAFFIKKQPTSQPVVSKSQVSKPPKNAPDIYYIIVDRYANEKTLRDLYGFDNSTFLSFLTNQGFFTVPDSRANYPGTTLSLASSLNLEYLDDLTNKEGENSKNKRPAIEKIQKNLVAKFLKERGYKIVNIGSWWSPTQENKSADFNFFYKPPLLADEFSRRFFETTFLPVIAKNLLPQENQIDFRTEHRNAALYGFKKLNESASIKSPKFVFAHILLPHDPYIFDKDCNPLSQAQVKERKTLENYLDHTQCTNKKLTLAVEKLLAGKKKPVIIIQSDEGPHPILSPLPKGGGWKKADNTALREKLRILSTFYLPGVDTGSLYPSISPVNSFRLVFNLYFGQNFKLLPDRTYIFPDEDHFYKFIEVTNSLL